MSAATAPSVTANGGDSGAAGESVRTPASVEPPAWQAAEEPAASEPSEPTGGEVWPNANPEDTNVWPDANAEAAFLAEARQRGEPVTPAARSEDEKEEAPKQMPKLDELVEQIPAETRELMEDLFRARFVTVRRVRKADLKPEEQA